MVNPDDFNAEKLANQALNSPTHAIAQVTNHLAVNSDAYGQYWVGIGIIVIGLFAFALFLAVFMSLIKRKK